MNSEHTQKMLAESLLHGRCCICLAHGTRHRHCASRTQSRIPALNSIFSHDAPMFYGERIRCFRRSAIVVVVVDVFCLHFVSSLFFPRENMFISFSRVKFPWDIVITWLLLCCGCGCMAYVGIGISVFTVQMNVLLGNAAFFVAAAVWNFFFIFFSLWFPPPCVSLTQFLFMIRRRGYWRC